MAASSGAEGLSGPNDEATKEREHRSERVKVVGFVPDLMDRSRFPTTIDITFVRSVDELPDASKGADAVVVDLSRPGALEALSTIAVRRIGFVNHTNTQVIETANAQGVETLRRSQFFAHIADILSDAK